MVHVVCVLVSVYYLHPEINISLLLLLVVSFEQSEYSFGPDDSGNDINIQIRLNDNAALNQGILSLTSFVVNYADLSFTEGMPYS